ncbi:carboxypeptidase regulatory-like domain-containing protein [Candidatus Uhrbacteria bacterium]|nr:carboxypeptidase regulatory-like domain-containing protein [Candidatus Uhrbacteria bacterium]
MKKYRDIFFLFGVCSFAVLLFYIVQKQITESIPSNVYILAPADVQELNQSSAETIPIFSTGADDYFFSSLIESVFVSPKIAQAGAVSRYEVEYLAQKSLFPGGTITVQFPFDFGFADMCPTAVAVPENSDMNGFSSGAPAIDTIICNSFMKSITVRVKNDPIRQGDTVRFLLDGIINSNTPLGYSSSGYIASIQTQDHVGNYLEALVSLPFFLEQAGTQTIEGTVFVDDGAGTFGVPDDGIRNGLEAGLPGAQVCLGGFTGYQCQTTSATGTYRFGKLSDGYYSIDVQPLTAGTVIGGPFFQSIELRNGLSKSGIEFGFSAPNRTITVSVANIPSNASVDVFAFNAFAAEGGGSVLRELPWNGNNVRSVTLPVSDGFWEVGVGPALSKDPLVAKTAVFEFLFIPPKSKQIVISGSGEYSAGFVLQSADKEIKGKVVNGSGIGIPNVFVSARPAVLTDEFGKETSTQSRADGSFILKVAQGTYSVSAYLIGLPPPPARDVTVKTDTDSGVFDGNATADIYSDGARITNDGDGGKDNFIFKINTRGRSITGRVLDESSQPIAYAFVSAEAVTDSGDPTGDWSDSPADATGKFTLLVNDGTWKMRAFDPRYGEVGMKTAVVNGANLTGQDIQSSSTFGTIAGSVKKNDKAAAGVFVTIFGPNGSNGTVTDKNGEYSVKIKAGGGYAIEGFLPGTGHTSRLTDVAVSAGNTVSGRNLTIQTPGTISVSIPGISDAYVDAFDVSGRGNGTNANATLGVYALTIPPGTYTVAARSIDYGLLGEKKGVTVVGGSTTTIEFLPPRSYIISGKIISSSPICKSSAFVSLSDINNGRMLVKTTDASGTFSLSVPSGSYTVSAGKPGCIEKSEPATIVVKDADILSGADRTLVAPTSGIEGRVTLSGSNTAQQTVVMAESTDGRAISNTVDISKSSGNNYSIRLAEGTWTVRARSDGYESSRKTVTIAAGDSQTAHLTLSPIAGFVKTERVYTSVKPSQGGVVKDSTIGDDFAIKIPAGSLGNSSNSGSIGTKVTTAVVEKTATAQVVGGKGIEITPKDSSGKPITTLSSSGSVGVTVTIPYSESDVASLGIDESKLVLATWSAEKMQWDPLATTVNAEKNTLTASAQHFSVFAPIVPAEKIETPAQSPDGARESSEITQIVPLGTALPPSPARKTPLVQPVQQPIAEPSKQTSITPSIRSDRITTIVETRGGVISVSIPPQALSVPATMVVVPLSASDTNSVAPFAQGISSAGKMVYDISLQSDDGEIISAFDEPATIALSYSKQQVAHLQEDTLTIQYWDRSQGRWIALGDSTLDKTTRTVTATTRHFTLFAITGLLNDAAIESIGVQPRTDQRQSFVTPPQEQIYPVKKPTSIDKKKAAPIDVAAPPPFIKREPVKAKESIARTQVFFDVSVSVPQSYKQVEQGKSVIAQIRIDASEKEGENEVDAHYVIKDSMNTDILTAREPITVRGTAAFVKSFMLPIQYGPGDYRIVISLPGYDTEASAIFHIRGEGGKLNFGLDSDTASDVISPEPFSVAAIAGVMVLLAIGALARRRRQHKV